ncbi:MAG: glycosyltransferase [Pseudomonadota bacterium]
MPRNAPLLRVRGVRPPPRRRALSRVQILLALHNGAAYLGAQLGSLDAQGFRHWTLLVSDDASTDHGPELVRSFAARHPGRVRLIEGPAQGATANFVHLIRMSDDEATYLAFCDQDDVWLPHKLEAATAALHALPEDGPALYCSRTLVCDAALSARRPSRMPPRALGFRNALVQNVVAGNTIVLNPAAARLAREEAGHGVGVAAHDWWLYQLISGAGGAIVFDPEPGLLYRQHGGNEIGVNRGFRAGLWRVREVLRGRYSRWNAANTAALAKSIHRFTPENRALLQDFSAGRRGGLLQRLAMLRRTGVYRQGRVGQAALWLAACINRL